MSLAFNRRLFLISLAALFATLTVGCASNSEVKSSPPTAMTADQLVDDIEKRTFEFFWNTTNTANGLTPDRYPTQSFSSIAAVGYALTAYPVGVERGYVTRQAAIDRVLTTLRFLRNAPQGPEAVGNTGYKGFFYHFLDMRTGLRFQDTELSTVDTTLLLGGVLFCGSYFDRSDAAEAEIRNLADAIYARVDWRWAQARPAAISMGWTPEQGFIAHDWKGYDEAMLVYLLALGSPTHPVEAAAWSAWTSTYDAAWQDVYGFQQLFFPPLFGHQFSHIWVDFRKIQDSYMRGRGIDYFENSRRAVYAQRAYAIANPQGWKGYDANVWGVSASDGPGDVVLSYGGSQRQFHGYAGRGMGGPQTYDDGTLSPMAAAASIAFAPEIAIPAMLEMYHRYGNNIYARYGFVDAFNPSFDFNVSVQAGRVVPGVGWVDGDYLGLDQGPIVAMIENYRSDLIWRVMRGNVYLRLGLTRAGFTGGWLN
jgi:hypothetical protein